MWNLDMSETKFVWWVSGRKISTFSRAMQDFFNSGNDCAILLPPFSLFADSCWMPVGKIGTLHIFLSFSHKLENLLVSHPLMKQWRYVAFSGLFEFFLFLLRRSWFPTIPNAKREKADFFFNRGGFHFVVDKVLKVCFCAIRLQFYRLCVFTSQMAIFSSHVACCCTISRKENKKSEHHIVLWPPNLASCAAARQWDWFEQQQKNGSKTTW